MTKMINFIIMFLTNFKQVILNMIKFMKNPKIYYIPIFSKDQEMMPITIFKVFTNQKMVLHIVKS